MDQIAQMAGVLPIGISPKRRSMARLPAAPHDAFANDMVLAEGLARYE